MISVQSAQILLVVRSPRKKYIKSSLSVRDSHLSLTVSHTTRFGFCSNGLKPRQISYHTHGCDLIYLNQTSSLNGRCAPILGRLLPFVIFQDVPSFWHGVSPPRVLCPFPTTNQFYSKESSLNKISIFQSYTEKGNYF